MPKRFVLLAKFENTNTSQLLSEMLISEDLDWSHYYPNSWLIFDEKGTQSVKNLRQIIQEILPHFEFVIFEVEKEIFSGRGRKDSELFKWLNEKWK